MAKRKRQHGETYRQTSGNSFLTSSRETGKNYHDHAGKCAETVQQTETAKKAPA